MADITRTSSTPIQQQADHTTLTQADIDNGNLIANVGFAPVKPAEFVVVAIPDFAEAAAATPSTQNPGKPPFAEKKRKT
jgi:hypothetical protein